LRTDEQQCARLLTPPHNFAVVQLPDRRFPGVVVQRDTLHSLTDRLARALARPDGLQLDEIQAELEDVHEMLAEVLRGYESVCSNAGIELPYRTQGRE
jgi:uncharacterized protein DUF6959